MAHQLEPSKAAKLSGYIYVFTVDVLRVAFTFSSNTSLDSVHKLCDMECFMEEGDFRNICERINQNLKKCSIQMRATDGGLKHVKDAVFVYVFPHHVPLSSAKVHRLFKIPGTRLEHPPTNHTRISVEDMSNVLVVDERERVLRSLQCARVRREALAQATKSTVEQDNIISGLEAQLHNSSIVPYTESSIREAFAATLQQKNVAAEKEKYLEEHYTVFRRIDIVILPTRQSNMVGVVSPSIPQEEDEVKCATIELKRMMEQATQQCLAECHAFLAALTVTKLNETLVDHSTGYALELRRGACKLHIIQMLFQEGKTTINSYPESDAIGVITSLVNHMLMKLQE